ncbi:MAG: hypothetical protein ACI4XM_06110 [Candidatus Coprovivens sp.]
MKKILKTITFLVLLIIIPTIAHAENIELEWTKYLEEEKEWTDIAQTGNQYVSIAEKENEYIAYADNFIIRYDKNGKLKERYVNDDCSISRPMIYLKDKDKFICVAKNEIGNSKSLYVMNDKLEIEKEISYNEAYTIYRPDYILEKENYYTFIYINSQKTITLSKDFTEIKEYNDSDLTEKEFEELWGKYNLIRTSGKKAEKWQSIIFEESDNYYLLSFYDYKENRQGFSLYDKNFNLLKEKNLDNTNEINIKISNNGIYAIEMDRTELISGVYPTCTNDPKCYGKLEFIKYDFDGNEIFRKEIIGAEKSDLIPTYGDLMEVTDFILEENSLTTAITFSIPAESNFSILSLTKYNFIYDIKMKTDGNGIVLAKSKSAQAGDNIEYEIIANNGYLLKNIKITT